jgi:uncharacterized membrane protein YjjP (DUF1212 family)
LAKVELRHSDANIFDLALGCAAVCLLSSLLIVEGATLGGCVVGFLVRLLQRHIYSRLNFKLNLAAALVKWCQLLSAWI